MTGAHSSENKKKKKKELMDAGVTRCWNGDRTVWWTDDIKRVTQRGGQMSLSQSLESLETSDLGPRILELLKKTPMSSNGLQSKRG
ncbi:jg8030 [Pararge aegeria aegeria]|uniref:Jg8030 protein n=1 Tax=Pararge aegeria aegeria TaxID=348720 RepID=A0A8S4RKP0_9NEOP|nr:jg8030 [Pararge aegeria aegeria]